METCSVYRCTKKTVARGFCSRHYTRWHQYGDPLASAGSANREEKNRPECDVEGCDRRSRAHRGGMCFRHYQRKRNSGSVKPTRHFLSQIDIENRVASCEICGPASPILVRKDDSTTRCKKARQEERLRANYGVEPQVFYDFVEQQGGLCAICGLMPPVRHGQRRLFLDHDHATGKPRAALCQSCNIALGMIRDSPELAEKLAVYLRLHGEAQAEIEAER